MDESVARVRIEQMTAWDQEPQLSEDEVTELVVIAARADGSGLAPAESGWAGSYDLDSAASEGWLWKAGKVAGKFDFVTDSQRFNRSQLHAMCIQMHDHYRRRVLTSPRIRTETTAAIEYLEAPIP